MRVSSVPGGHKGRPDMTAPETNSDREEVLFHYTTLSAALEQILPSCTIRLPIRASTETRIVRRLYDARTHLSRGMDSRFGPKT